MNRKPASAVLIAIVFTLSTYPLLAQDSVQKTEEKLEGIFEAKKNQDSPPLNAPQDQQKKEEEESIIQPPSKTTKPSIPVPAPKTQEDKPKSPKQIVTESVNGMLKYGGYASGAVAGLAIAGYSLGIKSLVIAAGLLGGVGLILGVAVIIGLLIGYGKVAEQLFPEN